MGGVMMTIHNHVNCEELRETQVINILIVLIN